MDGLYDVIVVGTGPAGLSAAIYAARARFKVLVLEKEKLGGQITITSEVVNYPGIESIDGTTLTDKMRKQAENFGAEFKMAKVLDMDLSQELRVVKTDKGDLKALGVVLALGANPRMIGFQGEETFKGRGVAYCATCDGEFFTGMDVFVIGGGYAAAEEAVFLTKYAKKVTIIVREDDFTCAGSVADKAREHEKIEVHYHTEIVEAAGDTLLRTAKFRDIKTGEEWQYDTPEGETFGIFVFAGYVPDTSWIHGKVALNHDGYIITDPDQMTDIPGIYGAGDVCVKNLRQVVTAVSDGAIAATSLEKYVADMWEKLGIEKREEPVKAEYKADGHSEESVEGDEFITPEMKLQLKDLFGKFERKVTVKALLNKSPLAAQMEGFLKELSGISDQVECLVSWESEETTTDEKLPAICVLKEDGTESGLRFYAIPGGHEFNSFVIGLYNVAGPGQAISPEEAQRIKEIKKPVDIIVAVSLSCTMCPTTVMSAGRIAAENELVNAWTYDLNLYPELKERYQIMSVPCMIINQKKVEFGKKSLEDLLNILETI
ncbi:FAD-dependent oxidoreductase [Lacrimispora algidixylanolytica]|uniref:Thioredoxin reductase n=1 Tax=Lacrimispora algidixylanolytica TaxID=94868 RepID=A0A419T263_9FIRM|nr:FAD-dependent oxidoreductase [Lacrimispora algidixylanolytica]RKD31519.1 thioredoxin reductase [Lacrimispora algidixylanolytica]